MLGDLGAEVIKVEPPGGDPFRFQSAWISWNRGKKGIVLDLSTTEGREHAIQLAGAADVLVESFRPGDMAGWGLAYDTLSQLYPRLVYCSVTGFGQTGPFRERPGYDFMIQGMGGMMSVTGEPDGAPGGGPQRAGVPIADIITGMYASIAVCAALVHRAQSGAGQHLDLALLDSQIALLAYQNTNYFATGKPPGRIGNLHPNIVPYQPFRAADGEVILACGNDNLYRKFCQAAGCTELAEDPRFASNGKRVENRAELTRLLGDIFRKRTKRQWVELLDAAGVPNGPINDIAQVFAEPQVKARGVKIELGHPVAGTLPMVASPMRFSRTPLEFKTPPPLLGEHTEEVLQTLLAKTPAEIARLRAEGTI